MTKGRDRERKKERREVRGMEGRGDRNKEKKDRWMDGERERGRVRERLDI